MRAEGTNSTCHLLVTGFTGFLGKVWVAFLLDHLEEVGRLTLLVRGRRDASAVKRVRDGSMWIGIRLHSDQTPSAAKQRAWN